MTVAITYSAGFRPADASAYMASEKLDGFRARWNRGRLWLQSGATVDAPRWWLDQLPADSLDGELYAGRGRFADVGRAVHAKNSCRDLAWQSLRFLAFDLPDMTGAHFSRRAAALRVLSRRSRNDVFDAMKFTRLENIIHAETIFHSTVSAGGEGLMLHRADALRPDERGALVKMKPLHDAEATVVDHVIGTGSKAGACLALVVDYGGIVFKLANGLHDSERLYPPRLGACVTFAYRELTPAGVPRFAKFLRERHTETIRP